MISILHPSRGRSERSAQTLQKWIDRAKHPDEIQIIISVDTDDPQSCDYLSFANSINAEFTMSKNRSAVDAINKAARIAKGDIFIVVSDDTDCPEHWDRKILDVVEGKTDWLLKCPDGGTQDWIVTMPIMDRVFYNRFGYVYYPQYLHMFCDTELTAVGDLTGRIIKANIVFEHLNPVTGKTQADALNERANGTWDQGKQLFLSRSRINFGVDNPAGRITDSGYLSWIASELQNKN
jgi:hypothetical protein